MRAGGGGSGVHGQGALSGCKPDPLGAPDWFLPLAPAAAFAFLAVAFAVWRLGGRKYTSTGT